MKMNPEYIAYLGLNILVRTIFVAVCAALMPQTFGFGAAFLLFLIAVDVHAIFRNLFADHEKDYKAAIDANFKLEELISDVEKDEPVLADSFKPLAALLGADKIPTIDHYKVYNQKIQVVASTLNMLLIILFFGVF